MNIVNFDADKRIATIQLSTTEVQKIKNLLYFYYSEDLSKNDASIELYKDFFILFELLTHKKLDSWATTFLATTFLPNSEEKEETEKNETTY